jgi:nitrite reductase/ring-hydroxylating ferredoxin subunit
MMIGFGLLGGKAAAVVRASLSRFGAIGTGRRKPTTERPKGSHSHRRRRRRLRLLQSLASWCRACRARPVRGVGKTLGVGQRGASKAPGRLGRWLRKLGNGQVTDDGYLQCPWHGARYDVATGEMVRGPQGAFKPLAGAVKATTGARPLKTFPVEVRDGAIWLIG